MVHRQIELDEEIDRILTELADAYDDDLGQAIGDLLQSHEGLEVFAAGAEEAQGASLVLQKERSQRGFREGRFVTWAEVKRAGRGLHFLGENAVVLYRNAISADSIVKKIS